MLKTIKSFSFTSKLIVRQSIIAAIYAILTYAGWGVSYGPIQFRFSEILNWLAFFDPKNIIGLTLGCFLSNLASPLGIMDLIFGSLHTFLGVLFMAKSTSKWIAMCWHSIFSFIIALELLLISAINAELFLETYLGIAASELIVVGLLGIPVFSLIMRNKQITDIIVDGQMEPIKKNYKF